MGDASSFNQLPPGFLFSPTDQELVLHFLYSKTNSLIPCNPNIIIPDLDMSLLDPWEFNGKALSSGNDDDQQYYIFTRVKENYRSTKNGYWKEVGVTQPIFSSSGLDNKVGIKNYLVFHHIHEYQPDLHLQSAIETETNWVMQEYHICSSGFDGVASYQSDKGAQKLYSDQNWSDWVLCRVYEKKGENLYNEESDSGTELSWLDEAFCINGGMMMMMAWKE